mgnify:CR=1 FL=1
MDVTRIIAILVLLFAIGYVIFLWAALWHLRAYRRLAINLHENETLLLTLHRHWFIFASQAFAAGVAALMPFLILLLLPMILFPHAIFWLLASIYWLMLVGFLLVAWIEYRLDVWIVTTERIIDVEQRSLFSREVSEFLLSRVQDVTVEVPNLMATLLHYGNIVVQTAGEKHFTIREIPHLDQAKEIILEQCRKIREPS